MLYPRMNAFRELIDLSGFWDFRFDPDDEGRTRGWGAGFAEGRPIAVPASWNDQFEDGRDFLGPAWYQASFTLPDRRREHRHALRFGSVNYLADVWLNGEPLGSHEGGHLPFEFDIGARLRPGRNTVVVRVDGALAPDRVPPGNVPPDSRDWFGTPAFPPASFDFFPFCGIHRPVLLASTPPQGIDDIIVDTGLDGGIARVRVRVRHGGAADEVRITLEGHGTVRATTVRAAAPEAEAWLEVEHPALWEPGAPRLHELRVELLRGGEAFDSYGLPVGIRTIAVEGDALLLNGKPIHLRGFGRHEDFPVSGRGLAPAVIVKDYRLMSWVGANSFRTSHYPYSEQMMDLADRLGFLVIDEIPAVGLFFHEDGLDRRLALCRQYVEELIARDRNHPCVIAWSLANEPHSNRPAAKGFFRKLYDHAKGLDPSRPALLVSYLGVKEEAFAFSDLVCLNRYFGWYSEPGRLDEACAKLSAELDDLHRTFGKPVILTEFGADAVSGCHAQPPEMFSEEYQAEFLERYLAVTARKPYVVGEHVWNLCDFKTSQDVKRFGGMNLKGVFTRDRRPKMAAHTLRRLWRGGDAAENPAR